MRDVSREKVKVTCGSGNNSDGSGLQARHDIRRAKRSATCTPSRENTTDMMQPLAGCPPGSINRSPFPRPKYEQWHQLLQTLIIDHPVRIQTQALGIVPAFPVISPLSAGECKEKIGIRQVPTGIKEAIQALHTFLLCRSRSCHGCRDCCTAQQIQSSG